MKSGGWLIVLFLFAMGCTNPGHVPAKIIQKDSMRNILWDLMLADQYSTVYLIKDSAQKDIKLETMKLYQQVFDLHRVTKAEFDESYSFYLEHPNISAVLFDSLAAMANRKRNEAYRIPTKPVIPGKPAIPAPVIKTVIK
jgi:hypothetical protein